MMTTLQNKEIKKGPKKIFAPPSKKLCSLTFNISDSPMEEILREETAETDANVLIVTLEKKEEKTATMNSPGRTHEKEENVQAIKPAKKSRKVGRTLTSRYPDEKQAKEKEKIKPNLTSEEFEEIVKIVLQNSCQKNLETTCAPSMGCAQLNKETDKELSDNDSDGEQIVRSRCLGLPTFGKCIMVPEMGRFRPSCQKKFNRFPVYKRKKETQNDKMEEAQGEHKKMRKDQLKDQPHCQVRNKEKERGFSQPLVWVQCSLSNCKKWRKLHRNVDPTVLPDKWSCDQNTDLQYNCCDIPEETWTEVDCEVVYASYIPGSIIWAKQYGYPWWPGMIEPDPDLGRYFLFLSPHDSMPSKYHVTFFGETVTRAWIPVNMLKNFRELSWELSGVKKYKNKDFAPKLNSALTMAQEAEKVGIQERVNTFGFWSRYSRSDSGEEKDVMPSGNNSLNSSLENEEKNQRK